ncbi:MAG TPA: glycosyltransferase family 39 protein [Bryobacteraceae bacterium]
MASHNPSTYSEPVEIERRRAAFPPPVRMRRFWLFYRGRGETLLAFLGFFLVVSILQRLTGGVATSFGLFPDEPAHYISSLLLRDYLASGFHQTPLAFAVNYYTALPYFAVGYWPPAFYVIGGIWMLLFGVQRASALALIAVVVALLAATVFRVTRRHGANPVAAGAWALLVLLIPQAIRSSSMYMLDLPVALFSLWALLEEIRYFQTPGRPRHAIGYALCASLAFLIKFSGGFVFLLPVALVAGTRKWSLLRNKWFWIQPAIVVALCGPWILYTHRLIFVGLPSEGTAVHPHVALGAFFLEFARVAGPVLVTCAVAGMLLAALKKRWNVELFMYAAAPVCVVLFLAATPVGANGRYFLAAIAPLILLIACSFERLGLFKKRALGTALPAILLAAGAIRCAVAFPHYPPDRLRPLVQYVNANPNWSHASILLPPDCEGPAIAEFAEYAPHRPFHTLLRPSKILGISGWWGIKQSRYATSAEFERTLARNPIDLIITDQLQTTKTPVDHIILGAVQKFPNDWRHAAVVKSPCGHRVCGVWDIYASKKAPKGPAVDPIFRKRTLNRYKRWRGHPK